MSARMYLFDDARARAWTPLSTTRPVGELLYGAHLQRERWSLRTDMTCAGHLGCDELIGFDELDAPPVVQLDEVGTDAPRLIVSSRAVPGWMTKLAGVEGPCTLVMGHEVVGWILPAGEACPTAEDLLHPNDAQPVGTRLELEGDVLQWPWTLLRDNPRQTGLDLKAAGNQDGTFRLTDVHILGEHFVSVAPDAKIDPGVILDAGDGPIRLDSGVIVEGPARLSGPLYLGRGTTVFGGSLAAMSAGPRCKLRGEISTSVILGFSNKAHDGYVGHSYLGRWVNLGAMTTTSDLKNNYSNVRVRLPEGDMDTGVKKLGTLFGDHVKTGIGTMINTGSILGCGSNLFGGTMPPAYVPPFRWGAGDRLEEFRLDKFLGVAEIVMGRREQILSDSAREMYTRVWQRTRST